MPDEKSNRPHPFTPVKGLTDEQLAKHLEDIAYMLRGLAYELQRRSGETSTDGGAS